MTAEAARLAIAQAREADGLLGVCEDDLMVITCAYAMAEREPDETGMPDFVVEPSSVKFILIEAV